MRCQQCDGEGLFPVRILTREGVSRPVDLPCPRCRGSGRLFDNENEQQQPMALQAELVEDDD